jgi:putative membrane protein
LTPRTILWFSLYLSIILWSAYQPKDSLTWVLEALPALVALALLMATYRTFPLTPLAYQLILFHAVILLVGAHYTYAEVPAFETLQQWLGTPRNDYDKLGHFAQGLVPALLAREIVIRLNVITQPRWRTFFILCFVLAVSASYELIEWAVALLSDEAAEAFLGTQGYEWDTQSDMFWALIGAVTGLFALSKTHDGQLQALLANTHTRIASTQ